jgi:murein DD-endopeptidase MepM/ murein hydrolase activator NlpD
MRIALAACLIIVGLLAAPVYASPAPVTGLSVGGLRMPPAGGPYRWPLDGRPAVVRPFAPPPRPWLPGHRGVDLAGTAGAPVFAAGNGVVAFAGLVAGKPVVSVDHPNGLRTTYEPVLPRVTAGQPVRAGDVLGELVAPHPGCPVAACLHWGLRAGNGSDAVYLDPLSLLGLRRVRLLPLAG